jgi:hypothetical protein
MGSTMKFFFRDHLSPIASVETLTILTTLQELIKNQSIDLNSLQSLSNHHLKEAIPLGNILGSNNKG